MRHFSSRAGSAALFLAVALWPVSAALGQDYEIKLHRPVKVGDKQHVQATARIKQQQTIKMADKVVESTSVDYTIECAGVLTTQEVDEKGQPQKFSLAIEKCTVKKGDPAVAVSADGKPAPAKLTVTELVPNGATVVVSMKGDKEVVEINGQPAEEAVQQDLPELFPMHSNSPTDDEIFGTKERKKVGDRWAGNAEAMANDLSRNGLKVKKEDVSTTSTLEKVVKVGGMDCLQISGAFEAKGVEPPVPPGFNIEKSLMQAHYAGLFPVDPKAIIPEESADLTGTFVIKGKPDPNGPEVTIETIRSAKRTERRSDAK